MIFETESSIYMVTIENGTLPKKSGIKILNQPLIVLINVAVKAGETSPVQAGETFIGDQLKIEKGRLVLYNSEQPVLQTDPIVFRMA